MRNGDPTSHSDSSERLHILAVCKLHNFMVNWMFVFADWCQDVLSVASSSLTVIDAKKLWRSARKVKESRSMRCRPCDTFSPPKLSLTTWSYKLSRFCHFERVRSRILSTSTRVHWKKHQKSPLICRIETHASFMVSTIIFSASFSPELNRPCLSRNRADEK